MTPFVLLIGLGVHAVFEGISLGMSKQTHQTIIFAIAIILHKGAAGMSLGISMAKTFPGQAFFCCKMIFLFSLFTPFGVAIGWGLLEDSNEMVEIWMTSLAAGTFLYIACSEIIVEEFSVPSHRFLKLFAYLVGIAIISSLKFLDA